MTGGGSNSLTLPARHKSGARPGVVLHGFGIPNYTSPLTADQPEAARMRICVYEDRHVQGLEPLTLTRPACDLLCGLNTLLEKQVRYFAASVVGHLCPAGDGPPHSAREPNTSINDSAWLRSAPTVLVNARWVPPRPPSNPLPLPRHHLIARHANPFADAPFVGTAQGAVAFVMLDMRGLEAVAPATLDDCLDDWGQSLPTREVGGAVVGRPWELIDRNGEEIARDFEATCDPIDVGFHPTGFAVVGHADRLLIDPSAQVDPMVVADTTHGPVVIGPDAIVHAFTRLEGPCAIGAGTIVHGRRSGAAQPSAPTVGSAARSNAASFWGIRTNTTMGSSATAMSASG